MGGYFRRWLGHKGGSLIIEISAVYKEAQPRKLVYFFGHIDDTTGRLSMKIIPSTRQQICITLNST